MATMYQSDVSENVYEQEWGELATRPTPRFDPSLMKVKKDELQRGLLEGRYTPEAVNEVIFREKYAQLGLLDLDKTDVLTGLKTGGLTAEQANSWADHKENPGWFWTKELVWRGAIGGIMRGFQNTKELFDEAIAMLTPDDPDGLNALIDSFGGGTFAPEGTTVTAKEQKELIGKLTPNLPQTDKPVTGAGQLVGAVTQFGSGFIGGQRIMKAVVPGMNYLKMGLTTEGKGVLAAAKEAKLINSSWADFAMKYPRAAWATGHLVENYGAGAITDFAVWGPDQDRLADWLVQFPWAKDTFLEYLTSDPEDHFTLARAKNAIEGGLTGVVAEPILKGIFHLLKGAKGSIWTKMGYDKEAVADVAADLRGKVEAKAQALAEPPDLAWVNYKPGMKSTGVSETKLPFVQEPEPIMKSMDEAELKKFLAELPEEQRAGVEKNAMGYAMTSKPGAGEITTEATPIRVQRIEEPGVETSFDKPQGLYTTPEGVDSPHTDLGGIKVSYEIKPEAKILDIPEYDTDIAMRKGAVSAGAGVHAARHFLGDDQFKILKGKPRRELIAWASKRYPFVDFSKYYDAQEVMEAIGGLEARKAGYDVFRVEDKKQPEFSEIVILNKDIAREINQSRPSEKGGKPVPPEVLKDYPELPEEQRAGVEIKQIGNEFVLADKAWFLHNDAHDIILSDAKQGELYEKLVKGEAVNPLELMKYPKLRALVEGISEGKNRIPSDMGLDALTPATQKEIVDCLVTIMSGGRNIVKEGGQPFQNWGKFITNPEFSDAWDTALKKVLGDADKYGAVKAHMTFEDIERIGRFYDMSPDRIAKMNKEVSGFAAKLSKMQQVLADYSAYVDDLVERALKADDDGLMVEALEHIKTLGDMYINAKGVKTAMGRSLATLKMVKQGNALGGAEWAQKFAENEFTKGGDARLLLKKYRANTDVRSKLQYAKTLESKHYVLEAILELEQASLVSGATTNMFNVMGQGIATVFEGISRSMAATYMGRKMGEGWTREFLTTQWQGYLYGMRAAVAMPEQFWKEAKALNLRKAWQGIDVTDRSQGLVWRAGKAGESVLDPLTKFEGVDNSALKYTLGKVAGDAGRATGEVLTASFRPLTMADEFFRSVNYFSHLFSTHFEAGWKEGLRGDKLNEYVKLAVKNPSVASVNDALKRSRDTTLNANMPRFLEKINQGLQGNALGLTAKILALPFVKVPANIARYQWEIGPGGTMARAFAAKGLDSTAIAKMSGRFAEDYAAGGLRRQEAIARVYLGNFLVVMGAIGYMSGNMTSGMLPWERSAAQTAGIRGDAVQVGEHQIPIDRYAPVMSMFVMGADLARIAMAGVESAKGDVDFDQVLKMMPLLANSMLSQVGLKDVNAVLTSLFDSRGITADSVNAGIGRKIQSVAPFSGLVKNLYAMFGDGEQKKIWSAWDGVVGSYLRNSLQTMRHPIFGEKLDNDPYLYMGPNQRDPLTTELFKLGVDMRPMDRKLTRGNQEIKLTPKDYDRVHEILESQNVRGDLQEAMTRMTDVNDERIKAARLQGIIGKHRAAAQGKFLMERPDLIEQLRQGGQATAEAARGGPTRHDAKKYTGDKPWLNNLLEQ